MTNFFRRPPPPPWRLLAPLARQSGGARTALGLRQVQFFQNAATTESEAYWFDAEVA